MKQPLKVNLQLFGEGGPGDGQAPSLSDQLGSIFDNATAAQPEPQAQAGEGTFQEPQQGVPTEGQQIQQTPEGQSQQPQQPEQPKQEDLILGKFKSPEDVIKAYSNLEKAMTKTFMDKASLAKEKAALEAKLKELETKVNQPTIPQPAQQFQQPQPQQAPEPEINPEEFLEAFYKNPIGSLKKIVEDTTKSVTEKVKAELQQEYKPVLSEFQQQKIQGYWNNAYAEFVSKTPDIENYLESMMEFMQVTGLGNETDPAKISQNIEIAYTYAKGATATTQAPTPSNPDDLLKDEAFVAKILDNPDIKQRIINQHMQTIQQNRPPQVISNTGGISPATPPPERPKNFNEANSLAASIYDGKFG